MRALLLAAGLGQRLRPLTTDLPKCLVPVCGRPLMSYWLQILGQAGIPVLINMHYFPEKVLEFIKTSGFANIVQTVYEKELLGTAGTLLKNRDFFGNEPVMLIHADNLSLFDLQAFINRHQERPEGSEITMMTFRSPTPESCGIVELDDRGMVRAFYEKIKDPPGNIANGAVYVLEPSVFYFLETLRKEIIDFSTDVIHHYIGRIFTFHNDVYHRDIGTVESYEAALREFPEVLRSAGPLIFK